MTARRAPLSDLPYWPRYLGVTEAARYVGVSPNVFAKEVANGTWPPARERGGKGGRLTWDRLLLDAYADRDSGLVTLDNSPSPAQSMPPAPPAGPNPAAEEWRKRLGKTAQHGPAHPGQRATG